MSIPASEEVRDAIRRDDLQVLRQALDASPLAKALGISFTDLQPGRASATLQAIALLPNFLGYAHTGAIFALAEQVMAAAANSLGHVGLPLSCEIHFLKGAAPDAPLSAEARVVDTQGRIARVLVEVSQGGAQVVRLTEMVFLRSASKP
ncbi:MAG: PaaI family thioesterase [Deltaproteobacteria bacterium]|nr:PaaI family thioesterase [Deltaproteobacteria bacterium]